MIPPHTVRFLSDEERAAVLLALASANDDQLCGALFSGSTKHLPALCQKALAYHCQRIVQQNRSLLALLPETKDRKTEDTAKSNIIAYGQRADEFTAAALAADAASAP